jgi:regulator of protease activity HflC (stomatin/prohibitin superfamily)
LKSAPDDQEAARRRKRGGVRSDNAERQREKRPAAAELETAEAKFAARRSRGAGSDTEGKEPKGTGSKGQRSKTPETANLDGSIHRRRES